MSDLGTMIARINDEMADPAKTLRIEAAVKSAIRFYEHERFWFNEGESTAETVAGQASYETPADLVEPDLLTYTEIAERVRFPLTRRPWGWLRGHLVDPDYSSRPDNWSYYADQIWLFPIPDRVYTLTMSFLQRLDPLVSLSDTNAWVIHGEELIRSQAKADLYWYEPLNERAAVAMEAKALKALYNLRAKSEAKIASGIMSHDDGLLRGVSDYNITYQ